MLRVLASRSRQFIPFNSRFSASAFNMSSKRSLEDALPAAPQAESASEPIIESAQAPSPAVSSEEREAKKPRPDDAPASSVSEQKKPAQDFVTNCSTTEETVGINCYVSPHAKGFFGILKQRYTDFIVHEVDLDGKQCILADYKAPVWPPASASSSSSEAAASSSAEVVEEPEAPKVEVEEKSAEELLEEGYSKLTALISAEAAQLVRNFFAKPEAEREKSVMLPVQADKEKRSATHQLVKAYFGKTFDTDTFTNPETQERSVRLNVWTKDMVAKNERFRRAGLTTSKKNNGKNDPSNPPPPYIEFVLYKENKDTSFALSQISHFIGVRHKAFSFAGTKDKRGVTTQRVTAYRIPAFRLASFRDKAMRIGNFRYVSEQLKLGMLLGNHFTVTIRNVSNATEPEIHSVLEGVRDRGFINYFGLQRFGGFAVPTHSVGISLLKSEYEEAVWKVLRSAYGLGNDVESALREYEVTRNADLALRKLPRTATLERMIIEGFKKSGNNKDYLGAFLRLPRNMRTMYVHAYQSFVWNNMASKRIEQFGADVPMEGDLILINGNGQDMTIANGQGDADAAIAAADIQEGAEGVDAEEDDDFNVETTAKGIQRARHLTRDDIASGKFSIFDVVLPMPGYDIEYPKNSIGEGYRTIMDEEGITESLFREKAKQFHVPGSYRKLLLRPQDLTWKFMRYNDPSDQLARTDLDLMHSKPEPVETPNGKFLGLVLSFSLPASAYATMLIREILKMSTAIDAMRQLNQVSAPAPAPAAVAAASSSSEEAVAAPSASAMDQSS